MHAYIDNNCLTFRLVTTMNFSFNKNAVLKGTVILTLAGIISRIAGFFYRIFLTRQIGADGIGMFQLVTPLHLRCALPVSRLPFHDFVLQKNFKVHGFLPV